MDVPERYPHRLSSDQGHTAKRASQNCGQDSLAIPLHPLRIKPLGNVYTATKNIKFATGHFSALPDDIIIQLLEFLDDLSLLSLGGTCKALFAFCAFDDLWKTLLIGYVGDVFGIVPLVSSVCF